ncbi:ArsR family transcriptional regulator [Acidovorax sp. NO-1]|uniref:ArsR/SmtB family transcription factor n=1 Tax=Acidovorax sp. NO-1 TaxID=512030 RepID=UPI00023FC54B|nr:metalloregulator ArsR/SmtB family transcription factor [Acidovorax sp. NO-1]EHL22903.1 ArsR family transcriptional regulator [Acidovorax sp. NO-1]
MEEVEVVKALGALAQETRLRIFRLLVVAGPGGMTPGHMAEELGASPTALSFHLKELSHSGLIDVEREGRNLIYHAHFDRMNTLIGYLTEHCCAGQVCEVVPSVCPDCGEQP